MLHGMHENQSMVESREGRIFRSIGGLFRFDLSKIAAAKVGVIEQLSRGARASNAASVKDIGIIGELKRRDGLLLDK